MRQLKGAGAAPAAWDHLWGVVEVGGEMMAGGAVGVKNLGLCPAWTAVLPASGEGQLRPSERGGSVQTVWVSGSQR